MPDASLLNTGEIRRLAARYAQDGVGGHLMAQTVPALCDEVDRLRARTPDDLRRLAAEVESRECTGVAAQWCPVHGPCRCSSTETLTDSSACPLHAETSNHAAVSRG